MAVRRLAAALVAGVFALAAAGSALAISPPGTLDQHHECASTNCNLAGEVVYPKWYSVVTPPVAGDTVALAQTFKPGASGPLSAVELYLQLTDSGSPSPFTVSILPTVGGVPKMQSPLATATIDPSAAGLSVVTPKWILVTFSTPATVSAGTSYAIAIGNGAQSTAWLQWQVDAAWAGTYTDYANGYALVGTHAAAPNNDWYELFQVLNPDGGGAADFAFRTYIGAAATPTPTATGRPTATPGGTVSPTATEPPTDTSAGTSPGGGRLFLPLILATLVGSLLVAVLLPRRVGRSRRR
jgi:hypothetical protein